MDLTDQFAEKPAPGPTNDVAGDIHQGIAAALSIRRPSPTEAARRASGGHTSHIPGLADGVAAEIERPTATSEATI
ncbi:hypothetical protein [Nocardia sp. XZ_19_231]|uniref:hypothetical protein n=1 Tax=Nocardia sp. XZ_19_231 TaxID=2769252 RepID=UPI001890442A|nr:hypothetical protein [Nocardia sp. XZ_19_231]